MTNPSDVREQLIGPFEHDEAIRYIQKFALALTNLGLNKRFAVDPWPRRIADRQGAVYQVVLLDKRPHEPPPAGLSALGIKRAEAQGYTKSEAGRKAN